MIGNGGGEGDTERGVYALAARDLFEQCGDASNVVVTVSYFELYKGQLYDLLEVSHIHTHVMIFMSHSIETFPPLMHVLPHSYPIYTPPYIYTSM
jgi:hypothetical protein